MNKEIKNYIITILLIFVCIGIFLKLLIGKSNDVDPKVFHSNIDVLITKSQVKAGHSKLDQVYIQGPVLIIDSDNKTIASCFNNLPEDIVAKDPSDVQTVVLYTYKGVVKKALLSFGNKNVHLGAHSWLETIVDIKNDRIISYERVFSSLPREILSNEIEYISEKKPDPRARYKELLVDGESVIIEKAKSKPCFGGTSTNKKILKLSGYPQININPFYKHQYPKEIR